MSPEKMYEINLNLSSENIALFWWENLADKRMTVAKLRVISYVLTVDDIKEIWVEKIAKVSTKEFDLIVRWGNL